jgi:hypothetical protein
VSFSGSRRCSRSTGSGMGGSGGGCRRRAGVHEELQDVLGVQKKARSCGSSCWQPAGCVAARAAAARRGGVRIGPARGGERRRGHWGGTWHRGERRGAAGARHMAGDGGRVHGREQSRGAGLEVDEGGLICYFPKVQGLHCKARLTFKP